MAIVNGYCTLDELKEEINVKDAAKDPRLERIIEAISRLVDRHCGYPWRRFWADTSDVARYFATDDAARLKIMDLKALTSLALDRDGDGVFEETWAATDYNLLPLNAAADSMPFTSIEVTRSGGKHFPKTPRAVRVTGKWGWPQIPSVVKEAVLLEANRRHKRAVAPFGIAEGVRAAPDAEALGIRLSAQLDVDARKLLKDLVRPKVAVS